MASSISFRKVLYELDYPTDRYKVVFDSHETDVNLNHMGFLHTIDIGCATGLYVFKVSSRISSVLRHTKVMNRGPIIQKDDVIELERVFGPRIQKMMLLFSL